MRLQNLQIYHRRVIVSIGATDQSKDKLTNLKI